MLGKFSMDKSLKDNVSTYMTMFESDAGIMPRAIHHIFQGLQRQVETKSNFCGRKSSLFDFSMLIIQSKLLILNYITRN